MWTFEIGEKKKTFGFRSLEASSEGDWILFTLTFMDMLIKRKGGHYKLKYCEQYLCCVDGVWSQKVI